MAFSIQKRYKKNSGYYGDVYWCKYDNDPLNYLCKKVKIPDLSLYIEAEASRRLWHLPTVYKVKGIETVNQDQWLVTRYINGVLLDHHDGSEMTSIFLHLLCTLEEMKAQKICHNDLHARNIIIKKSNLKYVKYSLNRTTKRIRVLGYLPVIIDFGLSRIDDFKIKPMISGLSMGNLASLENDYRFDKLKLFSIFSYILTNNTLKKMAAVTGTPLLEKMTSWITRHVYKLWMPLNYELEFIYKYTEAAVDYRVTGTILSFPEISPLNPAERQNAMRRLNHAAKTNDNFAKLAVDVYHQGPNHELFLAMCVIAMFLRKGIADFLSDKPTFLDTVPLNMQWINYILLNHSYHLYAI